MVDYQALAESRVLEPNDTWCRNITALDFLKNNPVCFIQHGGVLEDLKKFVLFYIYHPPFKAHFPVVRADKVKEYLLYRYKDKYQEAQESQNVKLLEAQRSRRLWLLAEGVTEETFEAIAASFEDEE